MKLTNTEKDILLLALEQLDKYYAEREQMCRDFKWICHAHLPQSGDGYVANKNVFDIQDKTIVDINNAKEESHKTIMKLINDNGDELSCKITNDQVNSMFHAKEDMKSMLGAGENDSHWKRHIKNIEKFLSTNGYKQS